MAGIYHNAELGLISLSSDGETRITISDKNLGATQVWNNGDALSQANAGKYYQWGNNYNFPFTGSVTTSSTKVDASNYGPGNYYSSSTFIISGNPYNPSRWDSTDNGNLRGGETGTNAAMQGPCTNGFHVPLNTEWQAVYDVWIALGGGSSDGTNFGIALKLPFAGYRGYSSADINNQGTDGNYWSSSRYSATSAYNLYFNSSALNPQNNYARAGGFSVRPFKNEPVIPDYNDVWDTLYGDDLPDRPPVKKLKWLKNKGNYYYFKDAPVHASSITLNTSSIALNEIGATYQLTATVSPNDAVEKHVYWHSSDESVATVSSNGLVTCISIGQATITASCDGRSATCSVDYTHVTGVTLNKNSISLNTAGQTEQLVATVNPSGAAIKGVTWSSSNTNIATVSSTGLVTCVTPGSCTITVTTVDGNKTATCSVAQPLPATNLEFLLIGGGGGGGIQGGGGAGGVIQCCGLCLSWGQNYPVVIGTGGNGSGCYACSNTDGCDGGNSTFNGLIAYGGGGGGGYSYGRNGGSGGGAGKYQYTCTCGGCGCPGQGYNGGSVYSGQSSDIRTAGGGGGGAGGEGTRPCCNLRADGGIGIMSNITGANLCYAGGGGGATNQCRNGVGQYGGGNGDNNCGCNATTYGSGGGAGYGWNGGGGGCGCQGVFILRYPSSCGYNITGGTKYLCNNYCIHCFTSNGTLTIN